jgi:hypothetical protein
MWFCTVKLDEENPTYTGLAQKNGLDSVQLQMLLCNQYDPTPTPCFWLAHHDDIGPGGLLLVVLHLFAVPVSVLWVGLQLECEKYFLRVTYWAPLEML